MLKPSCLAFRAPWIAALALIALVGWSQESAAQLNTILFDVEIQTLDTPKLRFHQLPLVLGTEQEYLWDVTANETAMTFTDAIADSQPFTVEAGAGNHTLYLARDPNGNSLLGDVGIGTTTPRYIAGPGSHPPVGGRVLNFKASAGSARFVVAGQGQAETYLVHSDGPLDQKILRARLINGVYFMSSVPDTAAAEIEPYLFAIRLSTGNVGIRTANPQHPLQIGYVGNGRGNGAHVTEGGVWTNASSRNVKQDIESVTTDQARRTVNALAPVSFRYKGESAEQYVGFIAEDVPDLVATQDRKSLAPMDFVAVLTKVVQDQDRQLDEQRGINSEQKQALRDQRQLIDQQQKLLESLNARLQHLERR